MGPHCVGPQVSGNVSHCFSCLGVTFAPDTETPCRAFEESFEESEELSSCFANRNVSTAFRAASTPPATTRPSSSALSASTRSSPDGTCVPSSKPKS